MLLQGVARMSDLTQLAKHYHAYIRVDNDFQRRARILQSIWRVVAKSGFDNCRL